MKSQKHDVVRCNCRSIHVYREVLHIVISGELRDAKAALPFLRFTFCELKQSKFSHIAHILSPKIREDLTKDPDEVEAHKVVNRKNGAWVVLRERDLTVAHEARDSKKSITAIR